MTVGTKRHWMQSCSVAWCALWNCSKAHGMLLRFAIWDCVLKWKAMDIQQAIQFLTGLKSGQECWGCGIAKTFATAAFWWTWTSKPIQTGFGGKTAIDKHTPLIYAICGGHAVWTGLFGLPRYQWHDPNFMMRSGSSTNKFGGKTIFIGFLMIISLSHHVHLHIAAEMLFTHIVAQHKLAGFIVTV